MAVAGKGTALLPRHIVWQSLQDGKLEIVKTKPLTRPIWAVMRSGNQSGVMQKLAAHIDKLLNVPVV